MPNGVCQASQNRARILVRLTSWATLAAAIACCDYDAIAAAKQKIAEEKRLLEETKVLEAARIDGRNQTGQITLGMCEPAAKDQSYQLRRVRSLGAVLLLLYSPSWRLSSPHQHTSAGAFCWC